MVRKDGFELCLLDEHGHAKQEVTGDTEHTFVHVMLNEKVP